MFSLLFGNMSIAVLAGNLHLKRINVLFSRVFSEKKKRLMGD